MNGLEFSPLFSFFNLSLPYNNDIKLFKDNLILVQYMSNEEFRKERENTIIGRLAKGTNYEHYAIQNNILDKNNNFISKKSANSKFLFAIIYHNIHYGIWYDYLNNIFYASKDYDPSSPHIFAMTLKDHSPNSKIISALSRYNFWHNFIENFKASQVYFENQEIKHNMIELIKTYISRI